MTNKGQVYIGRVLNVEAIENLDYIASASIVCGAGGKWKGVVKRGDFWNGDLCVVYLPDSLIPESEAMAFMKNTHWRVKMRRFRGAPSEVVIMPVSGYNLRSKADVGDDITQELGVTKYVKPVPTCLQGDVAGDFPGFVPKTDEPNYQTVDKWIDQLHGKPYYVTEKADGSSTTAYKKDGKFGVCSRNWERKFKDDNGYWKMAIKYDLENKLPDNTALQWETCGPGIQANPMSLKEISAFVFSGYNIEQKRYFEYPELKGLTQSLGMPMCKVLEVGESYDKERTSLLGEGVYANNMHREGVVVRSQTNLIGSAPISFKVINLNYDR